MCTLILPESPEILYIFPEQEGKIKGFHSIEEPGVKFSRRCPKRKVDFFPDLAFGAQIFCVL